MADRQLLLGSAEAALLRGRVAATEGLCSCCCHVCSGCPGSATTCCDGQRDVLRAGNFFFAGARLFFRSLEAAIFLFSRVARIPEGSLVLPAICTEERITLGAEMANGTIIRGQNEISHPAAPGQGQLEP